MKLKLSPVLGCLFMVMSLQMVNAQHLSFKTNFGTSFSSPKADLGVVAKDGKKMQVFITGELANHFNFKKKNGYGMKLAVVGGYDYANFLAKNGLTELKITTPNLRLRWYPVSFHGDVEDMKIGKLVEKLPFGVDMLALLLMYTSVNGLHFDYGVGFGSILETAYVEGVNFPDQTVKRTMKYTGWGLQPVIFQSESNKFSVNAVFDFGKYSWTNANKGTSAFKSKHLGFGLQWHFLRKGK